MGSIAADNRPGYRKLNIGIVGGGIGGLAAAIALRRAGHTTTIFERADFAGEVGASVSCAANGTRWLHEWEVDVQKGDPVVLTQLINRNWETGEPVSVYSLDDYEQKWGYAYNMFHRQYMHAMLMESAVGEGKGEPAKLLVNHKCQAIDTDSGTIEFENGSKYQFDAVIGADGIGSTCRKAIGISVEKRPHESSCLHTNVSADKVKELGLINFADNSALEYWGGHNTWNKIVLSPCNGGSLLSYYCFFPRDKGADYTNHTWDEDAPLEELLDPYPDLDTGVFKHLEIGKEIRPWRLWVHKEYPYWVKGRVCLLGDAAHPMMPHQSQGACMAIEDAACLGIVFAPEYFSGNVDDALALYQQIRKPRVKKVQDAAARASFNIHERIGEIKCMMSNEHRLTSSGFSSNTDNSLYKVEDESQKLTIEEMNSYDMYKDVEGKLGWIPDTNGLPVNA